MIEPHGGLLVDRVVGEQHAEQLRADVRDGPAITLSKSSYQDFINVSNGRFSPLEGFMTQNDLLKTVHDRTLEDGTVWTLPIVLDVDAELASELQPGTRAGLLDPSGSLVGAIEIEDLYKYDTSEVVIGVFGTSDDDHPGVRTFEDMGQFFVGGPVFSFSRNRFSEVDLLPRETRVLFDRREWETVVGFQTRNAPHRAHEYIQKSGLELVDGLLIQPKMGEKKAGDYRDEVILDAYQQLIEHYYPDDRVALSVFPSTMNYAGPREAIFDAIVRKNQGCSHFIVGRDHAGVEDYYDGFDSQRIFEEIADIEVQPLFYDFAFYCERCDGMSSRKICPHDEAVQVHPSGSDIRSLIQNGSEPSEKLMRPEVTECIMQHDRPFVDHPAGDNGE